MDSIEECQHVCHCACHNPATRMLHFINCCVTCDMCEQRIKCGKQNEHETQCHSQTMVVES
jgi:hypothetical protein